MFLKRMNRGMNRALIHASERVQFKDLKKYFKKFEFAEILPKYFWVPPNIS
jgi:hypothetical protein